jgi:L-amino acid N-acyltransferase YncA
MTVSVRDCAEPDLPEVLAIHNDAILTTTANWNYAPVDLDNRRAFLAERRAKGLPFLVAQEAGAVVGYASFGSFRSADGYHRTVEHSVYVRKDRRGRGVGGLLMAPLIAAARHLGMHAMVGGVDAANSASIRLHERFGFIEAGRLREVGYKFERYLDLVFMQKILAGAED